MRNTVFEFEIDGEEYEVQPNESGTIDAFYVVYLHTDDSRRRIGQIRIAGRVTRNRVFEAVERLAAEF